MIVSPSSVVTDCRSLQCSPAVLYSHCGPELDGVQRTLVNGKPMSDTSTSQRVNRHSSEEVSPETVSLEKPLLFALDFLQNVTLSTGW